MEKIIIEITIEPSHIDYSGNANNNFYIEWMEMGRLKLFDQIGMPIDKISDSDIVPALMTTHIDYVEPLLLGDCVRVEGWVTDLRKISAVMQFRFYRDKSLVATGYQKGTWVNRKTRKLARIPQDVGDRFERFLEKPA
jgi:acyl-CoA thioester hydrolase